MIHWNFVVHIFLTWSFAAVLSLRKKKVSNSCGLFIEVKVPVTAFSCNMQFFSCSAAGGTCVSPEVCVCNPGQFGPSCGGKCTCKNGECNGGQATVKIFTFLFLRYCV